MKSSSTLSIAVVNQIKFYSTVIDLNTREWTIWHSVYEINKSLRYIKQGSSQGLL